MVEGGGDAPKQELTLRDKAAVIGSKTPAKVIGGAGAVVGLGVGEAVSHVTNVVPFVGHDIGKGLIATGLVAGVGRGLRYKRNSTKKVKELGLDD